MAERLELGKTTESSAWNCAAISGNVAFDVRIQRITWCHWGKMILFTLLTEDHGAWEERYVMTWWEYFVGRSRAGYADAATG